MRNGVYFRLALTLPKGSVSKWKKVPVRPLLARIPGEHAHHEGGVILGGELTVLGKNLDQALATLDRLGMPLDKHRVAHAEKTTHEGKPHIRIETKGALKRGGTVNDLLDCLRERSESGEEYVQLDQDAKRGVVEVVGYLGGYEAYSSHFFPLLLLGAAAGQVGGTGRLAFLGDVELTGDSVFVYAAFSSEGVELKDYPEPQDITKEQLHQLQAALGDEASIRTGHEQWLDRFAEKKRQRRYAGRIGWLRPDGTFAIEPKYRNGGAFSEGLALVAEQGPFNYGFIGEAGEVVIPFRYPSAGGFKQGRAWAQGSESERGAKIKGAKGYIDRTGAWVCPPRYEYAEDFSEDRAVVGDAERRGYLDLDGREIVAPKYRTALAFACGFALVAEHSHYETGGFGFLDRDGQVAVQLKLERVGTFHHNYAPASLNGLWGFLGLSGKFVVEPQFKQVGYMIKGRAIATRDTRAGVIDEAGNTIIPFEYDRVAAGMLHWPVIVSAPPVVVERPQRGCG